jgi:hypothetical protein
MTYSKQEKLAREIASALDDMDALTLHEKFARKYSEDYLRRILNRVLSIPEGNIRKSRGALYTSLVQKNDGGSRM